MATRSGSFWQGKTVLITGASSGIGRALAVELARNGARLILVARRERLLHQLAQFIGGWGAEAVILPLDVGDPVQLRALKNTVDQQIGPVDVVIANAGRGGQMDPEHWDLEDIINLFQVNAIGAIGTVAAVIPGMLRRRSGIVIIISSLVAWLPQPFSIAYGASKASMAYFFESLRPVLKPQGIEVVTVYPGFVHTEMTAHGRYPMPLALTGEEAARRIIRGIEQGRRRIVFPTLLAMGIRLVSLLPEKIRDAVFLHIWRKISNG